MQLKRAVTMVFVGGACATWLAAAATSGRHAAPQAPATPASDLDPRAAALTEQIARLHGRRQPVEAQPASARNPFTFAARPPVVAAPQSARAVASAPVAIVPPGPPFHLDGIAEDGEGDHITRTAIVSSGTEVFVVREGDAVTGRYRVTKISPEVVELLDSATTLTVRLALP